MHWFTSEAHAQKAFDGLMEEYPDSFRAMDLAAEHRLRALHASWAWEQRDSAPARPKGQGAAIQQLLEVWRCCPLSCHG